MKMIFSIITVVLNDAEGLLVTADSVIKQTSKNFEWVVVDGGSSDDTLTGIKQLESVSPILHSSKDNGIYDAMNKGVELSTGQYLLFMNAGDSFADESVLDDLERFIKDNNSIDVILGGTFRKIKKCVFYSPPRNIRWIVSGLPAFHQSTIYKSDLMRSQKYNLDYTLLADYEWLAKQCVSGLTVGYLNRPVSNYIIGGVSYTNLKKKFNDLFSVKHEVLGCSRVRAGISSCQAILKTIFVMQVLYRCCGLCQFRQSSYPSESSYTYTIKDKLEFYKYKEADDNV